MEDLIKSIADKTGISVDQSKTALNLVLDAIKDKLPPALSNQIISVMNGKDLNLTDVFKEAAGDKLDDLKGAASEKLGDLKEGFTKLF